MNTTRRVILALFLVVAVIILHLLYSRVGITLEWIQEQRLYLLQMVQERYFFSVALYLLTFIVATLFGIPITVLLTIAAGYFFGTFAGVLYANIGATTGAAISFLVFRYLFGSWVQGRYGHQFEKFNRKVERHGHNYLLMMQFLPVTPILLINVFAGLTRLRFWTFIWTTSLGILPGSLLYTFAGRQLAKISSIRELFSVPMILALVLLALLAFAPVLIERYRNRDQ